MKASPDENLGRDPRLQADADPVKGAYLRFTVSGVEGPVTRARLRMWATNGSGNAPALYPTDVALGAGGAPWSESAVTWNARPARSGPVLDDLGEVAPGGFVEYDVTGAVTGDGAYAFELASGSRDGVGFTAREGANPDQRPQLIVDVGPLRLLRLPASSPPPPPPPPPAPAEDPGPAAPTGS